jgi:hypothetical protein
MAVFSSIKKENRMQNEKSKKPAIKKTAGGDKDLGKSTEKRLSEDKDLKKLNRKIYELAIDSLRRYLKRFAANVFIEMITHDDLMKRYEQLARPSDKTKKRQERYVRDRMIDYTRNVLSFDDDEYMPQ